MRGAVRPRICWQNILFKTGLFQRQCKGKVEGAFMKQYGVKGIGYEKPDFRLGDPARQRGYRSYSGERIFAYY